MPTDHLNDVDAMRACARMPFKCPVRDKHGYADRDYAAYWTYQAILDRATIGLSNEEYMNVAYSE